MGWQVVNGTAAFGGATFAGSALDALDYQGQNEEVNFPGLGYQTLPKREVTDAMVANGGITITDTNANTYTITTQGFYMVQNNGGLVVEVEELASRA